MKSSIFYKLFLPFYILIFSPFIGIASIHDGIRITFKTNSYLLTDSTKKYIDEQIYPFIKRQIDSNNVIVLYSDPCPKEMTENNLIGLLRSRSIIDYMQKKYDISRIYFFIVDSGSDPDENDIIAKNRNKICQGGFIWLRVKECISVNDIPQ